MSSINQVYLAFRRGETDWDSLITQCCIYIGEISVRMFRVAMEERDDTIAEFFPKLCALTANYQECGSSFEAYLTVSLRFFCRSRHRRRRECALREVLTDDVDSPLFLVEDRESVTIVHSDFSCPGGQRPLLTITRRTDTLRKQLLISFCKNLPILDDEQVASYTRLLQLPPGLVTSLETYVSDRREHFLQRRNRYTEQRDRHYAEMHRCQHLAAATLSVDEKRSLTERSEYHRRRWLHYHERLKRQNIHLSNREVGLLLGIPKGSVDSAMANLNRRLEAISRSR